MYGYIDHINEHRFGGSNDIENGQLLCHICHSKKNKYSIVSLPKKNYF